MTLPRGFVQKGLEDKVCLLKRSLYGLKQSGRAWNQEMNKKFENAGLVRSQFDPCVYFMQLHCGKIIAAVFADDTIIAENNDAMAQIKLIIQGMFPTRDLGPLHYFLGVRVNRMEDGSMTLDQEKYINEVLAKFGMTECKPVTTPMDPGQLLSMSNAPQTQAEMLAMKKVPYKELIGSLSYIAQVTRPDISFAVAKLGRFASNPGVSHWTAAKRVLRYLKGTSDYGLHLSSKTQEPLSAFVDADWAGDRDDRKSCTGYCLTLGGNAVLWKCAKQSCIANSTMEAEYVALAACTREIIWTRNLLNELGLDDLVQGPTQVWCDNQAAIYNASDPVPRGKTKHIEIRHHIVREACTQGNVKVTYIPTHYNKADLLTKALAGPRHAELAKSLGLRPTQRR